MNYEETKLTEALAICASDDCDGCPYYDFHQCYEQVKRGAHKLIIKQDQEIERLRTTLRQCNTELNSALESLKSQCREIGELKAQVKQANFIKERYGVEVKE